MQVLQKMLSAKDQVLSLAICRAAGVSLGTGVRFRGSPIMTRVEHSTISIGDRSVLISDSRYTALGVRSPVILRTLMPGAHLRIGDDVGLSGAVICAALAVAIGNGCLVGADVMIFDNDFHPVEHPARRYSTQDDASQFAPVVIERNVFIGARSIICKGVTIGQNSVIGAGSVVTRSVPENSVYAGSPAKFIRKLGQSSA
jgi:acetyltransferase-like isoleucine patch superfamily enzyme